MNLSTIQVNWVDLGVMGMLIVGLVRGRKRGMSHEVLEVVQWMGILVLAGLIYEPGGRWLSQITLMGLLPSYVGAYALVFLLVFVTFSLFRTRAAEVLASRDAFGNGEYYLGMLAGGVRYVCMFLVLLAFLNARYYTPQEVQAQQRFQTENYGRNYFPTLSGIQQQVFEQSVSGRFVRHYMPVVLIRATAPGQRSTSAARAPGAARPRPRS